MEIFELNTRYITNTLIKFQNKEIDEKKLNNNIFADLSFGFYFFQKKRKESKKKLKIQNELLQDFMKKEADQELYYNNLKGKYKEQKDTVKTEEIRVTQAQKRKELLNSFIQKNSNVITNFVENSYNTYIPPKNISISLNYHIEKDKGYKKYLSESDNKINYQNPVLNSKDDKIYIPYIEPPYMFDENTDVYILHHEIQNNKDDNNIIQNIKTEKINKLKNIMNDVEDDTLFYSEKLDNEDDIKNSSQWLNDLNNDGIESDFNSLSEERKNNKNFNLSNLYCYETKYSFEASDPSRIFEEIPYYCDRYKKFNDYLSDKSYKIHMKKMNYDYLDLMLLLFFDLNSDFQKYNFLQKETVALSFMKKFLLNAGICHNKIYESVMKIISSKKESFNFENFLDCLVPVLENKYDKCQTLKYRFLLNLVKNQKKQIVTMENYKAFLNLIKGKSIYDEEQHRKLSKNLIENFKNKFPNENPDNFTCFQIMTIVEYIIEGD